MLRGKGSEDEVAAGSDSVCRERDPDIRHVAWILDLPLAAVLAVTNAMWVDMQPGRWLAAADGPGPQGQVVVRE